MNFIELVAATYEECGVSGPPPADVAITAGETSRIVRWVKESWRQLQLQNLQWKWMLATATITCAPPAQRYAAAVSTATRLRVWVHHSARIRLLVADETLLRFVPYEEFLQRFMVGTIETGRPYYYTIGVNNEIILNTIPDAAYVITLDYRKDLQPLVANVDIPEMPATYHYAIVYSAMMKYARFESAPEIFEDAKEGYNLDMQRLGVEQLEPLEWRTETLA